MNEYSHPNKYLHADDTREYCPDCGRFIYSYDQIKAMNNWQENKPKFDKECLLTTASKIGEHYEYQIFQIKNLVDAEDKWYWGILCGDGEEWGDIADLRADLYMIQELPKKLKV